MYTPARTFGYSFAASLGLHGLLLLFAAWLITVLPVLRRAAIIARPDTVEKAEDETDPAASLPDVEVAFLPSVLPPLEKLKPEAVAAALPPPQSGKRVVLSRPGQPPLTPTNADTPFISSQNMRAASTTAPVLGADPNMISQEGFDLPAFSLTAADFAEAGAGKEATVLPDNPVPASTPATSLTNPLRPAERPDEPPLQAADAQRPPEPNIVKTSDPLLPAPPEKAIQQPAMRERTPEALPLAKADPAPPRPQSREIPPSDPVSSTPANPAKRASVSSVKTKSMGAIEVRGTESSVDAKDTPEGRYASIVHERVGLIWNRKLTAVRGLAGLGTVEVEFEIDVNGRVSNVSLVDAGKANPVLEDVCVSAIVAAKLPPPPPEMQPEMRDPISGGRLRRKFTFHRL